MHHDDLEKKFDLATKRALPYLVLAPPNFRNEVAGLMESMFHQLLQRSTADFNIHYAQVNELLDNRENFESNLENRVRRFANMFVSQEETVFQMGKQLVALENRVRKTEHELKNIISSPDKDRSQTDALTKDRSQTDALTKEQSQTDALTKEVLAHSTFFCEFCENSKLTKIRKRYYAAAGAILTLYHCPTCDLEFKFDDAGNSVPMKRNKDTLKRAEHRRKNKAEQQRTRPKPGTPSAPV